MAAVDAWNRADTTWLFGLSRSQVKRSLFGPIDHEANSRLLKEELEKQHQRDNQRWNFDFLNEVPLSETGEGDQKYKYRWTPVRTRDVGDAAPEMREMEEDTTPKEEEEEDKNGVDDTELTSREISAKDLKRNTRQTVITDFPDFTTRKRKYSSPGCKNGNTSSTEPSIKMLRRSSA